MKLWEVFIDNGQEYADYEWWTDLVASKTKEGALAIVEEDYKNQRNINISEDVKEIKEVNGYEVVLVKRRKKK